MDGEGGIPEELSETQLCERFGWTFTQLDAEDEPRVREGVALSNIRAALGRVQAFLETQGAFHPSESDWEIWGWAERIRDSNG